MPLFQVVDGTYMAFMVDDVSAETASAIGTSSVDFGKDCDLTLAVAPEGFTVDSTDTFIEETCLYKP